METISSPRLNVSLSATITDVNMHEKRMHPFSAWVNTTSALSAVFQKKIARLFGRIGSGVWVSASFQKMLASWVRTPPRGWQGRCSVYSYPSILAEDCVERVDIIVAVYPWATEEQLSSWRRCQLRCHRLRSVHGRSHDARCGLFCCDIS